MTFLIIGAVSGRFRAVVELGNSVIFLVGGISCSFGVIVDFETVVSRGGISVCLLLVCRFSCGFSVNSCD